MNDVSGTPISSNFNREEDDEVPAAPVSPSMTLIHGVSPQPEAQSGDLSDDQAGEASNLEKFPKIPPESTSQDNELPVVSPQAEVASPSTEVESPVLEEIMPDVEIDTSVTAEVFDSTFMIIPVVMRRTLPTFPSPPDFLITRFQPEYSTITQLKML